MKIKTESDIELLREGGRRLAGVMRELVSAVRPGIKPVELDALARRLISASGDKPAFLNYRPKGARTPFPAALCVSTNDYVVHGIPGEEPLLEGDIVSLDLGLNHKERFTDMAITVPCGNISAEAKRLLVATREALAAGIAAATAKATVGAIGSAVSRVAQRYGYGSVTDLGGHGVGHAVHEAPEIPNFGQPGQGPELRAGMVIAIEPMFNLGGGEVDFYPDGYTVRSRDGSLSAHFEQTILITGQAPEILTPFH